MAARHGNLPVARLLVIHGADVNAKNLDELTPLVLAAQEGQQDGCIVIPSTPHRSCAASCSRRVPVLEALRKIAFLAC